MPVDHKETIDKYSSYGVKLDRPMVQKAIEFAVKYHGSQQRASGAPYYQHPLEVAEIIASMHLDSDSIVTAILHDTIEDTTLTFKDIQKHFTEDIAKLVDGVTKLTQIEFKPENIKQAENFRKFLVAMSDDIRVLLIKLADRLHNMRTIHFIKSKAKRERIALETMEIYAPLAERIGMQAIKVELQDLCFKVLNPEIRKSIVARFKTIEDNKEDLIQKIVDKIQDLLQANDMQTEVYGRRKTPYSTWMKMKQKNIGIDQLSDIVAFRVIVENATDCYKVLGIIHGAYKMVPENFQDFISTPKENGYQSLHTVVIGPLLQKIEIQIRTLQMHNIAEMGVAAHWRYKQSHDDAVDGRKYVWLRELLSILDQNNTPEEFLQNTKLTMYYNQVFCFTPKGSIVALPKGATVVDFAYAVHSDIGNACTGAKVNGRMVPLKTHLSNGDQVEIITSSAHTASPSWEKFVVTGKARSEIKKVTRNQQHEQYVKLGRNIISKALKAAKIENEKKALSIACEFFNKSLDEIFFAVGEGTITREDVVKQAQPIKSKLRSTFAGLFKKRRKTPEEEKENRVPIKGLVSGMVIHYAKCCHPLPGDRIMGVIHTGSGITIHTSDCDMLKNFSSMSERLIDLAWDSDNSKIPFICRINIVLLNQHSGLAIVSTEIARHKGNIVNFKINNRRNDFFEMTFDIEVDSTEHIEKIIGTLRTKKIVQTVERSKY
ncbi:MAG: (p)ppGpp synthetase [Paracoccus sp.]|nr:MAG: (p)ppGpp synthetase [Paracoccus sp. (in: a-proteobacteria)]